MNLHPSHFYILQERDKLFDLCISWHRGKQQQIGVDNKSSHEDTKCVCAFPFFALIPN